MWTVIQVLAAFSTIRPHNFTLYVFRLIEPDYGVNEIQTGRLGIKKLTGVWIRFTSLESESPEIPQKNRGMFPHMVLVNKPPRLNSFFKILLPLQIWFITTKSFFGAVMINLCSKTTKAH